MYHHPCIGRQLIIKHLYKMVGTLSLNLGVHFEFSKLKLCKGLKKTFNNNGYLSQTKKGRFIT